MLPPPPDTAAATAARTIALQMLEERGRGAVLVGVARVDAALEHLLQALMAPRLSRCQGRPRSPSGPNRRPGGEGPLCPAQAAQRLCAFR